ncbi:coiled-coil domain-containing protein 134-like [Macrosteles quadrilineatus]|uniref:coiled-coil domain-containing protein 134-like n=1 Tax=Macrosteles quadrilineatus TaxID=74068 RepID=UPI0023E0E9DA|nr:coiled-coil domain-containing protein 134-like [Macrosteles quadrilineatus]
MVKIEESKQQKMVKTVTKTIFDVMLKSRAVLENSGYTPGVSEFPESESVKDALSLIIENTALIAEIVLRLPDVTEQVLRSNTDWSSILPWSLTFCKESRLLDSSTSKLFNLVSQELNFTQRGPDYTNPYRKIKQQPKANAGIEPVKKKKTPLPRGPRLTLRQDL